MKAIKYIFLFSFYLHCTHSIAQDYSIAPTDSLREIWLGSSYPDSIRCEAGIEILHSLAYSAPPESNLLLAQEVLSFAISKKLLPQQASCYTMIGIFNNDLSDWNNAESNYWNAYKIFEQLGNQRGMAGTLNNLANVVSYKGDLARSNDYFIQGLRIAEAIGDSGAMARLLGNIGVSQYEQDEFDVALDYFNKRIAIADAIGDRQCSLEAWICIGMTKQKQRKLEEAKQGFLKSVLIAKEINDVTSIASAQQNLGVLCIDKGEYDQGRSYLDSSLVLAVKDGDKMLVASSMSEIARSHFLQGHLKEALPIAKKALAEAEASQNTEVRRDAAKVNYSILKALGDTKGALAMYEIYITMRDSISNDANKSAIIRQKFQYDFEKKETQLLTEQEKKDAVAIEELRRKNVQRNAFIGGFALMVLLAGVFFTQRNRISKEKARSEELLLNILPEEVAEELKAKGEADARLIEQVTVLFTDFKGFTEMSEKLSAKELVRDIHECFSAIDRIIVKHGIEKIKTIGDSYMAAGGLPTPNDTHATDVVKAAIEIRDFIAEGKERKVAAGLPYFEIRIGIHTGPVVAGIVGVKKFAYDIWGDTVNTASRMESSGVAGKINISRTTYELLKEKPDYIFEHRGKISAKGKGEMEMWFVEERPKDNAIA